MAQQNITIGAANARAGDTLFNAWTKAEANFTDLYSQTSKIATKTIMINSTADLPAAFDQDDMCYIFGNTGIVIPTGGMEVTGNNVRITALNPYLPVTYNGTGNMFFGSGKNVSFDMFSPQALTGTVFNFSDAGSTKVFFAQSMQDINCDTLAVLGNFDVILLDLIRVISSNQGLTFSGAGGLVKSLTRVAFITTSATYVAIDLGSSVTQLVDIDRPTIAGPPGSVGLKGLASSGNIASGGVGRFQVATLAGGAVALNTIDVQDIRWNFQENPGLERSRNDCDLYFPSGTTDTITVAGVGDWLEVGAPSGGGGAWVSDISNRFTVDTATGVMTYIGEADIDVNISSIVVLSKSGGGSNTLECRIAKNWTGATTDGGIEKTRDQTENTTAASIHPGGLISLVTNDNLRLIFSNQSGTSNIVVDVSQFRVAGG